MSLSFLFFYFLAFLAGATFASSLRGNSDVDSVLASPSSIGNGRDARDARDIHERPLPCACSPHWDCHRNCGERCLKYLRQEMQIMDLAHCWDSVVRLVISSYLVVQVTGYLVGRLLMFIFFFFEWQCIVESEEQGKGHGECDCNCKSVRQVANP